MKRFFIGLAIGIVLGGTGAYTMLKDKVKKVATVENAKTVMNATQEYGETLNSVLK
jgi:hypothetical protein